LTGVLEQHPTLLQLLAQATWSDDAERHVAQVVQRYLMTQPAPADHVMSAVVRCALSQGGILQIGGLCAWI
jgi:hypothetical protein